MPISSLLAKRLYTPGPVPMAPEILSLGQLQTPYFRNRQFSKVVHECEERLLALANAPFGSRVIFLTASGTAAMEAVVSNLLTPDKTVGVINGGSFGQRFVDICAVHHIPVQNIQVDRDTLGDGMALSRLKAIDALLINAHETSIGHLYDMKAVGLFCRQHKIMHIVDAISLFVTDPLDMQKEHIDVLILSSHKGLALPPGLAMVILTPDAIQRVSPHQGGYYFNFSDYLENGLRGQTPFTPAVSIFLQLHYRLQQLDQQGLHTEWAHAHNLASHFRNQIQDLPLTPYSHSMPNAMTALRITNGISATWLVESLENEYQCVVAPNGGSLKELVFRVAHMGHMHIEDIEFLTGALNHIFEGKR